MRKIHVIFITLLSLLSCKSEISDYYAGIVVDETGKPIANALIKENTDLNPLNTQTDKNGVFKLKRNEGIICNLIVEKENYTPKTVTTFDIVAEPENVENGETIYSSFLTSDTTKIVIMGLAK